MKRIIAAIAVLVGVVGAFAFTPKDQNFCQYKLVSATSCPLELKPETFTIVSNTGGIRHITQKNPDGSCPAAVNPALCTKVITWTVNQ